MPRFSCFRQFHFQIRGSSTKIITIIDIDLAKNSYAVYDGNAEGEPVLPRALRRSGTGPLFPQSA
jgi:hypothetical protein